MESPQKWHRVALRLMGDHLPVGDLEQQLGLTPSIIGIRGEHRRDRQGNPRYAKYETNLWVYKCPLAEAIEFEQQISAVLEQIEDKVTIIRNLLEIPGNEGELFLGFGSDNGQGGAFLSHDCLSRIVSCGLSISLDLYPPCTDEETPSL